MGVKPAIDDMKRRISNLYGVSSVRFAVSELAGNHNRVKVVKKPHRMQFLVGIRMLPVGYYSQMITVSKFSVDPVVELQSPP